MRNLFLAVAFATLMVTSAFADQESVTLDICEPGCCEFTCVLVDVECCGYCDDNGSLTVEFLAADGGVLGTAVIDEQWCNGCTDEHFATLDAPVASQDIVGIRVTKDVSDCCFINWMSVKGMCELDCNKSKWNMLWKGDVWWWEAV